MDYLARVLCNTDEIQVFDYSLNSTLPHTTNCTQSSILVLIPLIFLIVFSPLVLYDLKKSRHPPLELYSPTIARIILCFLLIVNRLTATTINLITWLRTPPAYQPYSIMSCCWQTTTYCICLLLLIAYRNRGLVTSGVLFNFWLLAAICAFPELRRRAAYTEDFNGIPDEYQLSAKYVLYVIYYAFILFEVFLSCFADKPRYWMKDEKLCPEDNCSYLNKITFSWFHSLAARGFRRPLEVNDLWRLRLHEESKNLVKKFKRHWVPAVNAYYEKKRESKQLISLKKLGPKAQPSLLWALAKTYRWTILAGAAMKFVFDLLNFVSPQLLSALISYIEDLKRPLWMGITISFSMFMVALIQSMILHQYFHKMFMLGMNVRSVLTNAVYVKALLLSNTARKNRTVGEIVNLMSVDIQRFQDIASFIMLFWSAPFQILLATYFLWRLLGIAIVAGLSLLFATIPLTSYISLRMRRCQGRQMKLRDERLKLMSEILNGIRIIKFYAWEKSMQKLVLEIREKEIAVLREIALYNAAISLTWSCTPFLVAMVTFGLYVKIDPQNNQLTPQVTFVGLSLFNLIRFPMTIFPLIFTQGTQCSVSNARLKSFLSDDEMRPSVVDRFSSRDYSISIQDGNFSWDNNKVTLSGINLIIKKGELVAIVGKVGSGKSSLLSAILGEMDKLSGSIDVIGSIAYAPQQPWIQNLSLMDNILFGKPFDSERYETVLDACALKPDLATLPAGDQTEIGEKGINLSGGQKHRVSLARAVYANSNIVLLDDPLSAVDAHVGRHTFNRVISSQTGLLAKKTRILVTHGLYYLKYCDRIVVMDDGKITEVGTFQELIQAQGHFAEFLEEFLMDKVRQRKHSQDGKDSEEMEEILKDLQVLNPEQRKRLESLTITRQRADSISTTASLVEQISLQNNISVEQQDDTVEHDIAMKRFSNNSTKSESGGKAASIALSARMADKPAISSNDERSKLIEKEGVEVGKVKFAVYLLYLHAIGYGTTAIFIIIYIFSSVLGVSSNLWLANWSDHVKKTNITEAGEDDTNWRLAIYAALGLGQAAMVCTGSITMAYGMVFASRKLHEGILRNILHLPMTFFDITPLGRIVNRFGKDIEIVDTLLPHTSHSFISTVLVVLMTMAVILYATPMYSIVIPFLATIYFLVLDLQDLDQRVPSSLITLVGCVITTFMIMSVPILMTPQIILPFAIILFLNFMLMRFYISTSRQLKRLESAARSPIYSHFQESIQGSASIRAYRCMDRFIHESQDRLDKNIIIQYHSLVANRWLAVRLELVGNLIVFCSALFAVLYRESGSVTAGLVGLSVAYALSITQTLNWAVRTASELEANVVAVERLREYTDLPTEGSANENLAHTPPRDWPSKGEIVFEKLKIRYRDNLEFVLKGISATIHPAEKIGIVGRTGAGKSSLTLALFRIIEADSGRILIDGEDISKISLDNLRSKLTIVPQDPVVFSGTLRMNLDPFGHFDDAVLWNALRTAHLDSLVHSFPSKLEHKLSEGGENISVGQRQLLCLARAVLRMSQILILDEAAASVDMETDALIQKTIREQFSRCTVLTIAHRLHTVMNSDRVLVLESGCIREFDTPKKLLDDPDSLFHAMVKDSGLLPTKEH
ncbi:Multidrug resistance-associated protein [Dirofilaria immitis]